jgi:hypothetical protein
MADHAHLSRQTGMQVFFAHPHSPWERGINEHTTGLLRKYLPKGSDLSVYSQMQLDEIAFELNARPSKSLGWKCPAQLFLPVGEFDFKAYWAKQLKLPCVALGRLREPLFSCAKVHVPHIIRAQVAINSVAKLVCMVWHQLGRIRQCVCQKSSVNQSHRCTKPCRPGF